MVHDWLTVVRFVVTFVVETGSPVYQAYSPMKLLGVPIIRGGSCGCSNAPTKSKKVGK